MGEDLEDDLVPLLGDLSAKSCLLLIGTQLGSSLLLLVSIPQLLLGHLSSVLNWQ